MKNNFFDLAEHLRELLKSVPYSDNTYKDMDFIIRSFENYMRSNNLTEYSPDVEFSVFIRLERMRSMVIFLLTV